MGELLQIPSGAGWNVASSRKLFLTDKQVKALLGNTEGGFRRLVKAGVLTGARYGELARVKVKDFDHDIGPMNTRIL